MLRALLNTLVPPRERTVEFELPKIESAADALKASSAVIAACAAGELSPHEATEIMALISTHVRTIEVAELEVGVTGVGKEAAAMSLRQLRARLDRLKGTVPGRRRKHSARTVCSSASQNWARRNGTTHERGNGRVRGTKHELSSPPATTCDN